MPQQQAKSNCRRCGWKIRPQHTPDGHCGHCKSALLNAAK